MILEACTNYWALKEVASMADKYTAIGYFVDVKLELCSVYMSQAASLFLIHT